MLTIRTVSAEYLVAMKLKSGRRYKHDISDVMGILKEQKAANAPISIDLIKKAVSDLYGEWSALPEKTRRIIEKAFVKQNFDELYEKYSIQEEQNKKRLIKFEKDHPGVITEDNVDDIIDGFDDKPSILEALRRGQKQIEEEDTKRVKKKVHQKNQEDVIE